MTRNRKPHKPTIRVLFAGQNAWLCHGLWLCVMVTSVSSCLSTITTPTSAFVVPAYKNVGLNGKANRQWSVWPRCSKQEQYNSKKNHRHDDCKSSMKPTSTASLSSRRDVGESLWKAFTAAIMGVGGSSLLPNTPTVAAAPIALERRLDLTMPATAISRGVQAVQDPNSYAGLIYDPLDVVHSAASTDAATGNQRVLLKPPPLLLVLHGAAKNDEPSVYKALGDAKGEHTGLPLQLLASGKAPPELSQDFCVAAPYSFGQPSFYDDSREKILRFVQWLADSQGLVFDPARIFILGFSDGATVAVELATSRRFKGIVVASYGFTGESLPTLALQRLQGIGFWVFHSADDVIFDVGNSDRFVAALRQTNGHEDSLDLVRYTRYEKDPLPGLGIPVDQSMRGHAMGIAAARSPDVYKWLLTL